MSLSIVRILTLFIVLMIATVSLATETAIPDSSQVAEVSAIPVVAVAGDDETPAPPGSAWGVLPEITENQGSAADEPEKKKRVPKKTPEKDENQRDSNDSQRNSYYDDEDDGSDACVGACIGSFLSGIFNSSSEKEYEPPEQEEYVYQPTQTYTQPDDKPAQEMSWDEFTPAGFSPALDLSFLALTGPSDLVDEYMEHPGGHYSVSGYFNLGGTFEIGVDVGYSHITGQPLFDYETSTRLESPQSSNIQIFDTGVRFGMFHAFSPSGPFLRWGLGPGMFWVKETANLKVYSLPGEIYLGESEEALEDWRLGGNLVTSILFDVGSDILLGFSMRLFVIPWESSYTKALTLDSIGNKSIVGLNPGFTVHFNGF